MRLLPTSIALFSALILLNIGCMSAPVDADFVASENANWEKKRQKIENRVAEMEKKNPSWKNATTDEIVEIYDQNGNLVGFARGR